MRRALARTCLGLLVGLAAAEHGYGGQSVDCSERYPVGSFALSETEAGRLVGGPPGFTLVPLVKKPLPMRPVGFEDPCELVHGSDVLELAAASTPGGLVAGCAGDFQGRGARDYAVLLRRPGAGPYVPHVFLARGAAFDVVALEADASDAARWFGPFCLPKPPTGVFQAPDLEGTGVRARTSVVGDLFTVGWWTYYWRPDLRRFDRILTSD